MSSGSAHWQLDPHRNKHYYISIAERAYVYEDGTRIPLPAEVVNPSAGQQVDQRTPRNTGQRQSSPAESRVTTASRGTTASGSGSHDVTRLQQQMQGMSMGSQGAPYAYGSSGTSVYPTQYYGTATASSIQASAGSSSYMAIMQTEPKKEITDPRLAAFGVGVKGKIRGGFDDPKRLHPDYQVRRPGKKFFKRGKVFKVLWPEILGQPNDSVTVTSDGKYGEAIATKIRWFIVVMEGKDFCTCLPINTYGGRGVSKKGVVKWQHAIAYSSREEPSPRDDERPSLGEDGPMMVGVRVKPKRKGDKLDKMSRICFSRPYTIEHNIKAYDFGDVHQDSLDRLINQWITVIKMGTTSNSNLPDMTEEGEEEEDTSSEDDEEEDEEGEEGEDEIETQHQVRERVSSSSKHKSSSHPKGSSSSANMGKRRRRS